MDWPSVGETEDFSPSAYGICVRLRFSSLLLLVLLPLHRARRVAVESNRSGGRTDGRLLGCVTARGGGREGSEPKSGGGLHSPTEVVVNSHRMVLFFRESTHEMGTNTVMDGAFHDHS